VTDSPRVLIAGIGSPFGDDQAGWLIVDQLKHTLDATLAVDDTPETPHPNIARLLVRKARVPLDLLDWLSGVDILHVCDAGHNATQTGSLHHLSYDQQSLLNSADHDFAEGQAAHRGHDFGVLDVLRLAETNCSLPQQIEFWIVSGSRFAASDDISRDVAAGVRLCAEQIWNSVIAKETTDSATQLLAVSEDERRRHA